ncbi:hypothetical protein EYF80_031335 [Liparis tanakae]|uniref:Uncharacterized protein n=1 Tax=Liparis tanakae TaxID=230148 RepID=A0A4Z2H0T6_9TELE|nr:hypothetical protein EYF80_031335 [Liparis tanakae]
MADSRRRSTDPPVRCTSMLLVLCVAGRWLAVTMLRDACSFITVNVALQFVVSTLCGCHWHTKRGLTAFQTALSFGVSNWVTHKLDSAAGKGNKQEKERHLLAQLFIFLFISGALILGPLAHRQAQIGVGRFVPLAGTEEKGSYIGLQGGKKSRPRGRTISVGLIKERVFLLLFVNSVSWRAADDDDDNDDDDDGDGDDCDGDGGVLHIKPGLRQGALIASENTQTLPTALTHAVTTASNISQGSNLVG